MKKIIIMFFLLMCLCFPIKSNAVATNSSYSVKIYSFFQNDCKNCDKEKEWLENYRKESFIDIEYINIDNNDELYNKVKKELSIKKNKTPLVIIGSNYFVGFNNKTKDKLTKAIKSYEEADSYCDTVSKIRKNENIKDCINKNKGIYNQQKTSLFVKVIIVIISICLIVGTSLIIKKKKLLSRLHR